MEEASWAEELASPARFPMLMSTADPAKMPQSIRNGVEREYRVSVMVELADARGTKPWPN